MNKDQKLLEEAYCKICESAVTEPLYFGPVERKQELLNWLEKLKHEVHSDGSVSVEGKVELFELSLIRIPFNFRSATGHFNCSRNMLTSLEGAPEIIKGDFDCSRNNLTSLEGAPKEIGGDFYCYCNMLTSLEGAPKKVGGRFSCYYNNLTSLKGAPKEVGEDFSCHNNKLISLEGAPEIIKGDFRGDQFSDEDYRTFAKKRKYVDSKLDKELNIDLEDFS
jgi:hypothetical protein